MKTRTVWAAVFASFAVLPAGLQAQTLDATAAEAVMSGAKITGTNSFGNPYSVTFSADGGVSGVAGQNGEFTDTGRWWMDGAMWCREYAVWFDGQAACFGISSEGDTVRFHLEDGTVFDEAMLN